jgi:hypothetical protein
MCLAFPATAMVYPIHMQLNQMFGTTITFVCIFRLKVYQIDSYDININLPVPRQKMLVAPSPSSKEE